MNPEKANTQLAEFGRWCLRTMRNDGCSGDIEGGAAQDKAEELGLLVRVPVDGPCHPERCVCAETGEFPQLCLRAVDGVAGEPGVKIEHEL